MSLLQPSLFGKGSGGGEDPAGAGATCSRCEIRHRCPALISLARGVWGMITQLCPQRPPLSFGACLSKFDSKVNGRSVAERKMAHRRAAAARVCEEDARARGAPCVFSQRGKRLKACVHHYTPASFMPPPPLPRRFHLPGET